MTPGNQEGEDVFRTIVFKELRENILDSRFVIAALLSVIIIPLGFYINGKDYRAKEQNYKESVRIYDESHKTLIDVMRQGAAAFRAPSPLNLLSSGMEQLLPTSVETVGYITYWGAQAEFVNARGLDSPMSFLYGRIDLTFIVAVIMSLLAMLFTYSSVAGEKEKRTLSQILSNSVPRSTVILAKMTAGSLLIGIVFLLGIMLGLMVLLIMGHVIFADSGLFGRFLLAAVLSLFNILVFLNLGLLISGLNRSALSAIVSLISCWVILFLIWPKLSVIAAKIVRPIKSQQVIDLEKSWVRLQMQKEEYQEISNLQRAMPGVREMTSAEFFANLRKGEENAKAFERKQNEVKDEFRIKCDVELNGIDTVCENQRSMQAEIARNISRLSPVSCFIHIMAEISNTGFAEYREWQETKSRFKQVIDREISAKMDVIQFGNLSVAPGKIDRTTPMPELEYHPVRLDEVVSIVWPDVLVLFIYGVLFFAGSYAVFLRYDVR
jgi:ABC-type transport system involved in multi-copper enzyme maturation permease subunit